MLENTQANNTGKRLISWKSILGLGLALFIVGGLVMLVQPAAAQTADGSLTDEDIASLLYMREEEKLAHDVYVMLYDLWGAQIFNNIASSEQNHTEMVLALLNQYGLDDPAAGNGVGVFTNPDLQALYDDLVSQGSQSYEAALLVGGLIEEVDIADLRAELENSNVAAIQQVYQSLLSADPTCITCPPWTGLPPTGKRYLIWPCQYVSSVQRIRNSKPGSIDTWPVLS